MKRALLPCKLPDQNGTKTAQNTSRRPVQGAPLWIPAFAGMTKKDQSPRSHRFLPFLQNTLRHFRKTLSAISAKRSLSFPRRRESTGHYSDPHWGSFLESTESSMPAHFFRRFYVERSVGFVGYDVDRGCFMTGAPLWIPAFAGMTKKDQSPRSHRFLSFPQNALRQSLKTLSVISAKAGIH